MVSEGLFIAKTQGAIHEKRIEIKYGSNRRATRDVNEKNLAAALLQRNCE
jgi:hypothetical protein